MLGAGLIDCVWHMYIVVLELCLLRAPVSGLSPMFVKNRFDGNALHPHLYVKL